MKESRTRPWLAALLAFVYPGLGHVYLRSWLRAFAWFVLAVTAAVWVVPTSTYTSVEGQGLDALIRAQSGLPLDAVVVLLVVSLLNVADAYVLARRGRGGDATAADGACPECGQPLDDDLEFCHWCTTRFPAADDDATSR